MQPLLDQQQQQDQLDRGLDSLPEPILLLIAKQLKGGSLLNFTQTCKNFRQAACFSRHTLDMYELCGWAQDTAGLPVCVKYALQEHPNCNSLIIPYGWRLQQVTQILQEACSADSRRNLGSCSSSHLADSTISTVRSNASRVSSRRSDAGITSRCSSNGSSSSSSNGVSSKGYRSDGSASSCSTSFSSSLSRYASQAGQRRITSLTMHFQALCTTLCSRMACLAPDLAHLELCLDLAFELTTKQVGFTPATAAELVQSYSAD